MKGALQHEATAATTGTAVTQPEAFVAKNGKLHPKLVNLLPDLLALGLIVILAFAAYHRVLGNDFQRFWDDHIYVIGNEAAHGFTLSHLKSTFITNYAGNYAPLHILSYMLDYTVWELNPKGFLLTNIVLHSLNGMLLYRLLLRFRWSRVWAILAALIFLLHPVQVESVAWISERKNLLAMFFFLGALLCYARYRAAGSREGAKWYLLTFALFVFALLSKSVAVIFPLVVVLYDLCVDDEAGRRFSWVDKVPLFGAATLMAWVTIQFQAHGDLPGVGGGRVPYHGGSPVATALTMLTVLGRYLKLLFCPTDLSVLYDPPIHTKVDAAVVTGGVLFGLLVLYGVHLYRSREKELFFWYCLFFIGLLPVSQIVPIVTLMNDRYLYFPLLGAVPFLCNLAARAFKSGGLPRIAATAALTLALTALPIMTCARTAVWQNELSLRNDCVQKTPHHRVALYGYAQALQNAGRLDEALPLYHRALRQDPKNADTLLHLAALYRSQNQPLQERPYLLSATEYYPRLATAFIDLGKNYYVTNELAAAEQAFLKAAALDAQSKDALRYLGIISLRTRKLPAAQSYLEAAGTLAPRDPDVAYNLACVASLEGKQEEALQHLETALRLGFGDKSSIQNDPDLAAIRHLPRFKVVAAAPRPRGQFR